MGDEFSSVEAAVEAVGRGEIVIVLDAEDRENEGDTRKEGGGGRTE